MDYIRNYTFPDDSPVKQRRSANAMEGKKRSAKAMEGKKSSAKAKKGKRSESDPKYVDPPVNSRRRDFMATPPEPPQDRGGTLNVV